MQHQIHAARIALSLLKVDPPTQAYVLREVETRLDRRAAMERRDHWLRAAYGLIGNHAGSVRILSEALRVYSTSYWSAHRHLATPPENMMPLRAALFRVCQAAEDAGVDVPGYRQVRRIVCDMAPVQCHGHPAGMEAPRQPETPP